MTRALMKIYVAAMIIAAIAVGAVIHDFAAAQAAPSPAGVAVNPPTAALAAAAAAHFPEPVLLWAKGAPSATGDSDEDKPAIYPFLPSPEKNTGAAVIVNPGGAFTHRAMDQEGVLIAKYLVDHGIAAFVLRYRITPLYARSTSRNPRRS